jgi:uncharacterized SAM-binding protein YcdF (DUF218 family)
MAASLANLLIAFVYPLGAAILLFAAALALSFTKWRRVGQILFGVGLIILWIAAAPFFSNWLNWQLESQFPPVRIEALPQSDAVIVLGGIIAQPYFPRVTADLSDSADRITHALRIYRAGKAPTIIISAGNQSRLPTLLSEAQLIADFFVELGVPRSVLVLETESRNTRENATNTAEIFAERHWRSGLLVTSGAHMPRALAAFRRAGVNVIPAATDIHAWSPNSFKVFELLPDARALARTTIAIKEWIGLLYYWSRGWT